MESTGARNVNTSSSAPSQLESPINQYEAPLPAYPATAEPGGSIELPDKTPRAIKKRAGGGSNILTGLFLPFTSSQTNNSSTSYKIRKEKKEEKRSEKQQKKPEKEAAPEIHAPMGLPASMLRTNSRKNSLPEIENVRTRSLSISETNEHSKSDMEYDPQRSFFNSGGWYLRPWLTTSSSESSVSTSSSSGSTPRVSPGSSPNSPNSPQKGSFLTKISPKYREEISRGLDLIFATTDAENMQPFNPKCVHNALVKLKTQDGSWIHVHDPLAKKWRTLIPCRSDMLENLDINALYKLSLNPKLDRKKCYKLLGIDKPLQKEFRDYEPILWPAKMTITHRLLVLKQLSSRLTQNKYITLQSLVCNLLKVGSEERNTALAFFKEYIDINQELTNLYHLISTDEERKMSLQALHEEILKATRLQGTRALIDEGTGLFNCEGLYFNGAPYIPPMTKENATRAEKNTALLAAVLKMADAHNWTGKNKQLNFETEAGKIWLLQESAFWPLLYRLSSAHLTTAFEYLQKKFKALDMKTHRFRLDRREHIQRIQHVALINSSDDFGIIQYFSINLERQKNNNYFPLCHFKVAHLLETLVVDGKLASYSTSQITEFQWSDDDSPFSGEELSLFEKQLGGVGLEFSIPPKEFLKPKSPW